MDPEPRVDATSAATALRLERETAQALLTTLHRDHDGIVEASAGSNADDEHDPEGSTIAFERSQVGAMIEATKARLTEVEAAQSRIDHGTYGTCEACGHPMPPGRLEARPTARRCVTCA